MNQSYFPGLDWLEFRMDLIAAIFSVHHISSWSQKAIYDPLHRRAASKKFRAHPCRMGLLWKCTGNGALLLNDSTISLVLSVDPSSVITNSSGNTVCPARDSSWSSRYFSPLYVAIAIDSVAKGAWESLKDLNLWKKGIERNKSMIMSVNCSRF